MIEAKTGICHIPVAKVRVCVKDTVIDNCDCYTLPSISGVPNGQNVQVHVCSVMNIPLLAVERIPWGAQISFRSDAPFLILEPRYIGVTADVGRLIFSSGV